MKPRARTVHTYLDCIPCFFRQALRALSLVGADEALQGEILLEFSRRLGNFTPADPPPALGRELYALIRERIGEDPYREIKRRANREALVLYPRLKERIAAASDPLRAAVGFAIAANIIDYGAGTEPDLAAELDRALRVGFGTFEFDAFRGVLSRARSVLYLADNAGEIVFDRLLVEEILSGRDLDLTLAVRGAAVINDATRDDARQAGLEEVCRVIDNGDDSPGTMLERCSADLRRRFAAADLVVSKGQGNLESLWGTEKENLFFLFKVKCAAVERNLGLERGETVLLRNPGPA